MKMLKKIKEKIKQVARKNITLPKKKAKQSVKPCEEVFSVAQVQIEQTKFSHPQAHPLRRVFPSDLPHQYDQDRIILQVRDSYWIHAYWEVRGQTLEKLGSELGNDFQRAKRVLRVYDVSQIIFDGTNAHSFFDIQVGDQANSWYIDTKAPGRSWCVDFGLLLADGKFITIIRSNTVRTPLDSPSWITDEEWMIPDDLFARLYGMGFGLGRSSPVGKAWPERVKQALSSGGLASMASPVKKAVEKQFWLWVDCELIVYGATEPDAKVTVQDKQITLRPDGTFTLRFALPNGKQVISVKAVSSDKSEERNITPIVNRETR